MITSEMKTSHLLRMSLPRIWFAVLLRSTVRFADDDTGSGATIKGLGEIIRQTDRRSALGDLVLNVTSVHSAIY
jgi:hypothetical protein